MPGEEFWMEPKTVEIGGGTAVTLRPEAECDLEPVWSMFSSLSRDTLQFLPFPFTRKRVEGWFKSIDYEKHLPILGIIKLSEGYRVIASSTLSFHDTEVYRHKAVFGVTVHDDYQNLGLGTMLTRYMLVIAAAKGVKKVELDVVSHNLRAIRLYERCGFRREGLLRMSHWNYVLDAYGDDVKMGVVLGS